MSRKSSAAKVALLAAVASVPALAADWDLQPRFELGYQFDDNYRLDFPGNEIEVSGGTAAAELGLLASTQLTNFALTPRVRTTYFPDEESEESTDYFLKMRLDHERQQLRTGVNFSFADETVVLSELPTTGPEPGLGEPGFGGDADAGRISVRNRRQSSTRSHAL